MVGKTLYDKLWDDHLVKQQADGSELHDTHSIGLFARSLLIPR